MTKILLLSDTHGHLDEQMLKYIHAVDEVWHAGDIGDLKVTDTIAKIKPIRAVFGNIDGDQARLQFPLDNKFKIEKTSVWITHIGGYPGRYAPGVKDSIYQNSPGLFISGHSHIAKVQYDKKLDLLHINPGAAGYNGFHKIMTIVRFTISESIVSELELIELGERGRVNLQ